MNYKKPDVSAVIRLLQECQLVIDYELVRIDSRYKNGTLAQEMDIVSRQLSGLSASELLAEVDDRHRDRGDWI